MGQAVREERSAEIKRDPSSLLLREGEGAGRGQGMGEPLGDSFLPGAGCWTLEAGNLGHWLRQRGKQAGSRVWSLRKGRSGSIFAV